MRVWYEEFTLRIGRLRRPIDKVLGSSCYGVIVISPSFLAKEGPQLELDGLMALETGRRDLILPVWPKEQLVRFSLQLADRVAAMASDGIAKVVKQLVPSDHAVIVVDLTAQRATEGFPASTGGRSFSWVGRPSSRCDGSCPSAGG